MTYIAIADTSKDNFVKINNFLKNKNHEKKVIIKNNNFEEDKNRHLIKDDGLNHIKIKKFNFNFLNYLYYKLACGKINNKLEIYNDFRSKIISEECFIKNNLILFILLKANENKLINYKEKYQLKDLISII